MPIRRLIPFALASVLDFTLVAVAPFVGALASAELARASVVEALDLATLVQESDDVVLARVIKQWSHYDDAGRIVTDFQMQVERTEKGAATPGSAVVVRKLGGIVGERGLRIAGEPTFRDGELVLLFGARGAKTYLRPVGMGQGTLRVFEQDGVRWTRSDAQGMALIKRGSTATKSRAAVPEARTLEDVLAEVHSLVAAQR
jgi:hypothetical protein